MAKKNAQQNQKFYVDVKMDSEVRSDRDYKINLPSGEEFDMRDALDWQEQPDKPNQIILPTGEVCRIKKVLSARHPSPFVGDGITRYTVKVEFDEGSNTLALLTNGGSWWVEAV